MTTTLGVLYTGGTIGMQQGADGALAPAAALADGLAQRLQAHYGAALDWQVQALPQLIDSADATPATWWAMAAAVRQLANDGCAGVLVLHGTDTLAFSAAALSFLLLDLQVPVVLTGSMLPADTPDTDAWDNVHAAVAALQSPDARGVRLVFGGRNLSGVRAWKADSQARDAFRERAVVAASLQADSPRGSAHAAEHMSAHELPWQPAALGAPQRVAVLTLYPGFAPELIDALHASGHAGAVLVCYGSGTAPTADPALLAALARAQAAGMVLVAVSQCLAGGVEIATYEAGSRLQAAGVVDGGRLSVAAALAKLQVLLAAGLSAADCAAWMRRDLCGELA